MGELVFLGIFTVVSIYFFILTGDFRVSPLDKSGGAAVWPRIVLIFLFTFLVIRAVQVLKEKNRGRFVFSELFKGMRLFFLLSLVGYVALFKFLGYFLSTLLFLYVTVNCFYKYTKDTFGTRKEIIIRNAIITLYVALMYFFFSGVLKIMLPEGFLFS